MSGAEILLALAERCEREEPSEALDAQIGAALGLTPRGVFSGGIDGDDVWLAYTSSLDAAVTLVPEGLAWTVGCEPDFTPFARLWDHDLVWAASPALALCAAALRARAAAAVPSLPTPERELR